MNIPHIIQVVEFWVLTWYSDVVKYQCYGGSCSLYPQGELTLKVEAALSLNPHHSGNLNLKLHVVYCVDDYDCSLLFCYTVIVFYVFNLLLQCYREAK
jgi:hypothetical protein